MVSQAPCLQPDPQACVVPAKLCRAEESVNAREREALMNVKPTKEDCAGQIDFCSLLILEAHLQNSFEDSSRRPVYSSAPGKMQQNTC